MADVLIEAQKIPRAERHSQIFKSFDDLSEGSAVIIVNDHDPAPLLAEFGRIRAGQFKHEYVEEGPNVWILRIIRKKGEGCCGFCGG